LHSMKLVNIDILNQRIPFAEGIMSMAFATEAAVLPTFAVDADNGLGIKVVIEKPLQFVRETAAAPDLTVYVESFARVFESYVRRYPHLYRWSRENWLEKRRARGTRKVEQRYSTESNRTSRED